MRTLALILVALTACSSNYMPQSRGRVAMMIKDGRQAYVRDGRVYDHGFLGGGLVDAVQGNPRAMRAANEYHDRMKTGLIGAVVGIAAMLGGLVYAASDLDPDGDSDTKRVTTGVFVSLGGMVLSLVGAAYASSGEPYRWDAINIFNDEAAAPPLRPMPGYGPPTSMTLEMRD